MATSKQRRFLKLYQPIHGRFEKFCRARAFGDMPYKDLINETLLIAYVKMEKLNNKTAFLSFLIGIAIRVLSNSSKKQRPSLVDDAIVFDNHLDPNGSIEKKFEVDMLYKALATLPELQREALILFEITGYSIKEIMQIQESGASAVKQRLVRGRKNLAVVIKRYMEIPGEGSDVQLESSKI